MANDRSDQKLKRKWRQRVFFWKDWTESSNNEYEEWPRMGWVPGRQMLRWPLYHKRLTGEECPWTATRGGGREAGRPQGGSGDGLLGSSLWFALGPGPACLDTGCGCLDECVLSSRAQAQPDSMVAGDGLYSCTPCPWMARSCLKGHNCPYISATGTHTTSNVEAIQIMCYTPQNGKLRQYGPILRDT